MLHLNSGTLSLIGGSRLLGGTLRSDNPFFLCDCSTLEKNPATQDSQDAPSKDSDTDRILAAAFSSSGRYFALTDDRKRLVLYRTEGAWERLSVRWVSRRCTAITFSPCESYILVADKSGDVFSFSVTNIQEEGCLQLGHLSMLLDLVVTPNGRYIITCDRDEKIRVSLWEAPHVINAFCLGHTEFVSQLLVLPGLDNVLVSGSGDGTVRLWKYESGEQIHCWNLRDVTRCADNKEIQRFAVSLLSCSPGGKHLAVLCDGVSGIYLCSVASGPTLTHTQYISVPYTPVDLDFEDSVSLWVLSGVKETPIDLYKFGNSTWQLAPQDRYMYRLSETIQENWEQLEGVVSPENRFSGLYKVVFDNMASYLMKKEARLQAEKRKLSSHPSTSVKVQKT
ncbi:tRNA (guanine-N(7)-)-methyltransferase non-catalytic subunit WDR4 [Pyxicephalus adspersus]|uniref:tRNA (guanine-N(7)-)-methyltransferase non-catalytic subunit WDR4 n=1 Tax=Pyxicephalus adspersus TaxID=30357 RepID=UPI003B594207